MTIPEALVTLMVVLAAAWTVKDILASDFKKLFHVLFKYEDKSREPSQ